MNNDLETPPSADGPQAYFPDADASPSLANIPRLPDRPLAIELYDDDSLCMPLPEFDQIMHNTNFMPRTAGSDADKAPTQPPSFADSYLVPSLTTDERLRLTLLWYHTRDLVQDKDFLEQLQQKLNLVQDFLGWEWAILGLVSEDVFTRVVTVGAPLATVPRRESTCSHTVNQPPGSVFMVSDMQEDWRFRESPPVKSGLRSYAGAQLRCRAQSGHEVAIGSLCVGSKEDRPTLSSTQQSALARFADLLSAEIVSRSRAKRKAQRAEMAELIARSYAIPASEIQSYILRIVHEIYPSTNVALQTSSDRLIELPCRKPVSLDKFQGGLWEDTATIEHIIQTQNHKRLESKQVLRAIAHPYQSRPGDCYLVVASNQVQHVYDNVDSWFIERCAQRLGEAVQELRLSEALVAKDTFLRGITHQLRTPIHGVLAACEILHDELTTGGHIDLDKLRSTRKHDASSSSTTPSLSPSASLNRLTTPASVLDTIRDSGRELMYTVNNLIKLNRWNEASTRLETLPRLSTFDQIEADIIYDVQQTVPAHDLSRITIIFNNLLADSDAMVVIDLALLKDCIHALVLNAVLYTDEGSVAVVISASPNYSSLYFDVYDTGCGIAPADQSRIFDAYGKVDPHTRGVGLGLTLAAKTATIMGGHVSLVKSSQDPHDHGSHFRAEFFGPIFACPPTRPPSLFSAMRSLPRSFYIRLSHGERSDLVTRFATYLEHRGFEHAAKPDGSFVVITYTNDADEFRKLVESTDPRQVVMCLLPSGTSPIPTAGNHDVRFFSGPFLTARLEEIIGELDKVYQRSQIVHSLDGAVPDSAISDDASRTVEAANAKSTGLSHPRALLVDDNLVNLRIMRMYCEKRSISYVTAMDGNEAVVEFRKALDDQNKISLVLIDKEMPNLDGVAATIAIREIERAQDLESSCIFMVTGQDSLQDKKESFEAGANEFYVKPMSLKTLDRAIGEYFAAFAQRISESVKNKVTVTNGHTTTSSRTMMTRKTSRMALRPA